MGRAALGNDIPGAALAAATLGGYAELKLDVVKTHARTHVAGDVAIGNSVADADNHGGRQAVGLLLMMWQL